MKTCGKSFSLFQGRNSGLLSNSLPLLIVSDFRNECLKIANLLESLLDSKILLKDKFVGIRIAPKRR
jgi:hypothetical protein